MNCPGDIMTNKANITFKANATDDYTQKVDMAYSHNSGSIFPLGETMVTITATDKAHNSASCIFRVIHDEKGPDIACPDDIITT